MKKKKAMDNNEKSSMQAQIVEVLKTVYDPEIPVNIYDLGLVYDIEVSDSYGARIEMTLTAPNCPMADFIVEDVRQKVMGVDKITSADIDLVFEPEWDKDMMSDEAKLELGFM
jgi:FeS assembly SUF system protein